MIWASALLLGGGISGDGPTYGPAVATAAVCVLCTRPLLVRQLLMVHLVLVLVLH